jgi:hypothetical protein
MSVTDSEKLRREVEERRKAASGRTRDALLKVLSTPEGRRVWLLIRDEMCQAEKPIPYDDAPGLYRWAGRRSVAAEMDRRIAADADVRIALAKDRVAVEADQAAFDAAVERLKEEERNG